jgi:hypothetical protein
LSLKVKVAHGQSWQSIQIVVKKPLSKNAPSLFNTLADRIPFPKIIAYNYNVDPCFCKFIPLVFYLQDD